MTRRTERTDGHQDCEAGCGLLRQAVEISLILFHCTGLERVVDVYLVFFLLHESYRTQYRQMSAVNHFSTPPRIASWKNHTLVEGDAS